MFNGLDRAVSLGCGQNTPFVRLSLISANFGSLGAYKGQRVEGMQPFYETRLCHFYVVFG